jgi:hypothetical protein
MNDALSSTRLGGEVDWVMKFSRILFEGFELKTNREKLWWFLGILLRNEQDFKIEVHDLLNSKEMSELLAHKPNKYYHTGKFVERFGNDYGPFLDVIAFEEKKIKGKTQRIIKTLQLNSNFEERAKRYVALFLKHVLGDSIEPQRIELIANENFKPLIKLIFTIQTTKYLKAWDSLIEGIASASERYKDKLQQLLNEFHGRAPYWIVFLTVCKQHLEKPEKLLDRNDIVTSLSDYMRYSDENELKRCLRFITLRGGLELLTKKKLNGRWHYEIREIYRSAFVSYAERLSVLHPEFRRELLDRPELS